MARSEAAKARRREKRRERKMASSAPVMKEVKKVERVAEQTLGRLNSKSYASKGSTKYQKHVYEKNKEIRRDVKRQIVASEKYLTAAGAGWLERVTNPCAVNVVSNGIPDKNSSNVLTPSEREYFDLKSGDGQDENIIFVPTDPNNPVGPGTFQPGIWDVDGQWNAIVVSDASKLTFEFLLYQGDLKRPTAVKIGQRELRLRKHAAEADVANGSRETYYGTTMEFTAAIISDEGELMCAQLKPDYVRVGNAGASESYAWEMTGESAIVPTIATGADYDQFLKRYETMSDWLSNLGELSQTVTHAAREGVYIVHKIAEPTLLFKEHNQAGADIQNRAANSLRASTTGYGQSSDFEMVRYCDPYDLNAGVVHYTGLNHNASFRVKVYTQLEMLATVGSPMQYYSHQSPAHDENALDLAQRVHSDMPDAYPSAYNAFGWLKKAWNGIKNVGSKILKPLIPSLGAAAGNAIAPGAGGAIGGALGNMIAGALPSSKIGIM